MNWRFLIISQLDPLYKSGQSNPAAKQPANQEAGRQAGPLFQDLTSGWIQPESDNKTIL